MHHYFFYFSISLLFLIKIIRLMKFDYLFYQDLPKGVKSIYVNGKRLSLNEFNEAKKTFFLKKAKNIEP